MKKGLNKSEVSALYVTLIGRSGEKAGVDNWFEIAKSQNLQMNDISKLMLDTGAAKTFFAGKLDNSKAFVDHIYATTLNKGNGVDEEGKVYWAKKIDEGYDKGLIVAEMIRAAVNPQWKNSTDKATKDAHNLFVNKVILGNVVGELTGFVSSEGDIHANLRPFLKVNSLVQPDSTKDQLKQILVDNAVALGLDTTRLDEMFNKHTRASIIKEISGLDDIADNNDNGGNNGNNQQQDNVPQLTKEEKDKLIADKDKIADGSLDNLKLTLQDIRDFQSAGMINKIKDKGIVKIISDKPLEYGDIRGFLTVDPLYLKLNNNSIDDVLLTNEGFIELLVNGMGNIFNNFSVALTEDFVYDVFAEMYYRRVLKEFKDADKVMSITEFKNTPVEELLKIKVASLSFKDWDKDKLTSADLDKLKTISKQLKGGSIEEISLKVSDILKLKEDIIPKLKPDSVSIIDKGEIDFLAVFGFDREIKAKQLSHITFDREGLSLYKMVGGFKSLEKILIDDYTLIYQFQTVDNMLSHMSEGRDYIDMFHELRTLDNKDIVLPKALADKYGSKIKSDIAVSNATGSEFINGEGKSVNLTTQADKVTLGDKASKLKVNGFDAGQDKIAFASGIGDKGLTKLTLDITNKDFSGANYGEIQGYLVSTPIKQNGASVIVIKDNDSDVSQIYRIDNDANATVEQSEITLVGTFDANIELGHFVA